MAKKNNVLDPKVLNTIPGMSLGGAKETALKILESPDFKTDDTNRRKLVRDINLAKSSEHIVGIMYRILLAGEGMRTVGSTWGK